jgi:restriction system protein
MRSAHRLTISNGDERALFGVVAVDPAVSKGFITATSDFAHKLQNDPLMGPLSGSQLELVTARSFGRGSRS